MIFAFVIAIDNADKMEAFLYLLLCLIFGFWLCYGVGKFHGQQSYINNRDVYSKFTGKAKDKSQPVSLFEFATELCWSAKRTEKWLDARVKEFSGIKERQLGGDYLYYFGKCANEFLEKQQSFINEQE